jgi:hypothetical protein
MAPSRETARASIFAACPRHARMRRPRDEAPHNETSLGVAGDQLAGGRGRSRGRELRLERGVAEVVRSCVRLQHHDSILDGRRDERSIFAEPQTGLHVQPAAERPRRPSRRPRRNFPEMHGLRIRRRQPPTIGAEGNGADGPRMLKALHRVAAGEAPDLDNSRRIAGGERVALRGKREGVNAVIGGERLHSPAGSQLPVANVMRTARGQSVAVLGERQTLPADGAAGELLRRSASGEPRPSPRHVPHDEATFLAPRVAAAAAAGERGAVAIHSEQRERESDTFLRSDVEGINRAPGMRIANFDLSGVGGQKQQPAVAAERRRRVLRRQGALGAPRCSAPDVNHTVATCGKERITPGPESQQACEMPVPQAPVAEDGVGTVK